MKRPLIVFALLIAVPAAAEKLETLAAGSSLDALRLPALRFATQDAPARADDNGRGGRPPRRRIGTLTGTLNGAPIELRFTEVHRRVSGTVNGDAAVDIKAEPELSRITGRAQGGEVALKLLVSEGGVEIEGAVAGRPVSCEIDWKARTVRGEVYGRPLELDYEIDGNEWTITGQAGGARVRLRQAPETGAAHVRGTLQGSEAAVAILHVNLADFLTHFYLLVKP